jgi:nitrite reductase (NADH) large subunit
MEQELYYCIIGNGIAGLSAAEVIRQKDMHHTAGIISAEPYLTYNRLLLSHHLGDDITPESLYIHPQHWYDEKNITVLIHTRVLDIDTTNHLVKTNAGAIKFTKLIIASGSYSFIPTIEGSDKQGVFALRTMDNLLEINRAIKRSHKAIVIGGGVLGLEAAWALKQKGLEVTILEFFPRILPKQMDQEGSNILTTIIEGWGIKLYTGVETAAIYGDDTVSGVVLKDGRSIDADLILFSSGVRPYLEFVKSSPIRINKGIVVDSYLCTNVPGIYAAGDVAEYNGTLPGIWPVATAQGKVAGTNAAGETKEYIAIPPSNTLKVMGINCFSVGEIQNEGNKLKEIKYQSNSEYYKFFIDGDRLAGAIILGDITKAMKVRSLIEQKKDIHEYSLLSDAKEILQKM